MTEPTADSGKLPIKMLLVEDDRIDHLAFHRAVKQEKLPYDYTIASCLTEAIAILREQKFEIAILDFNLGDGKSSDLFPILQAQNCPFIISTGSGDEAIAARLMSQGASDYLIKDPDRNYLKVLPVTVSQTLARHHAEQQLIEREEQLRDLFENATDLIQSVDIDGQILFVNRAWRETLGYDETEIKQISIFQVVHPEELEHCRQMMQDLFTFSTPCLNIETRFITKDGKEIIVEGNVNCRLKDGIPFCTRGVFHDITQRKLTEAALSKSQSLLAEAQQVAQIGNWDYDLATAKIIWSEELFQILGRDRALGEPNYAENLQLYRPDDATKLHQAVEQILIDGQPYYLRLRLLRADGSIKYTQARGMAEFNQFGEIVRLFGTTQDITELVQIEIALHEEAEARKILLIELQESESRYRSVIASMSEGIVLQQADGQIITCNQSAEKILGLSIEQMQGLKSVDFERLTVQEDGSAFLGEEHPAMLTLKTGQPQTNVIMGICQEDHPIKWISINSQPLFHPDQTTPYAVVASFADITEQKLAQEIMRKEVELEHMRALTDGLTQVPNRRCFDERLQIEWQRLLREQQSLSLILIDIDYFKLYNDHYGHQVGDTCLIQIAQTAASQLKRPTDLFARYGGEEFVVILPNTDIEGAIAVVEVIQQSIRDLKIPHTASKVSQNVTISLGIASLIPTQGQSPEDLVAIADKNLYQAKQQGRDRFYWSES